MIIVSANKLKLVQVVFESFRTDILNFTKLLQSPWNKGGFSGKKCGKHLLKFFLFYSDEGTQIKRIKAYRVETKQSTIFWLRSLNWCKILPHIYAKKLHNNFFHSSLCKKFFHNKARKIYYQNLVEEVCLYL